MTRDYQRNGTTDLFAAMNIATGEVLTHRQNSHAAVDVLRFFKQIDAAVPRGLAIHVVLDNLSAHSAPPITRWLSHRDRRRWHLHFTPTSSSWLNLVERWFTELTDKRLRRGRFTSVADLTDAITTWATHWNADPKPFTWQATAEDIIAKVQRGRDTHHQIKISDGPLALAMPTRHSSSAGRDPCWKALHCSLRRTARANRSGAGHARRCALVSSAKRGWGNPGRRP